jgi:hypothetical protein
MEQPKVSQGPKRSEKEKKDSSEKGFRHVRKVPKESHRASNVFKRSQRVLKISKRSLVSAKGVFSRF